MKPTRHLQMLFVIVAVLCHGAGAARAEDGLVIIGGTADDPKRAIAMTAAENAAKQAGWSLTTRRMSKKETYGLIRCTESTPFSCLPSTFTADGIHRMLVVTVERAASDVAAPEVVLSGKIVVTSTRNVVVDRRFCESCADDRLAQEVTLLAENLLRQLATQSGRTMIEIKSEPIGVQIVFDGQRIGLTDAIFTTYPGKHLVTLERDGYVSETHEISVGEDKTTQISSALRATRGAGAGATPVSVPVPVPAQHDPEHRSLQFPAVMMAAGAVLILSGIALYATDQDYDPTRRAGYRDTALTGVVTSVGGLAISAAGAFLWWRWDL